MSAVLPYRAPFCCVLLMLTGLPVWAGTLAPGFAEHVASLPADAEVSALIILRDRVDVSALAAELHAAKQPMAVQHAQVVSALQARAAAAQRSLLTDLEAHASAGLVPAHRSYWLLNAVRVRAAAAVVRELAAREDVESVEPDLEIRLIADAGPPRPADKSSTGTADGVTAIGARRVWYELGITGAGALVGNLDTGVDSQHPALAHNWRGAQAPAGECWLDLSEAGVSFPYDPAGHGTHIMGTMVGVVPGDTVGVAPGALWIAANPNNSGFDPEFDADVIAALQFMADPDGDPLTSDDVPDAVQNSWGVMSAYPGYDLCDSRWWEAIDACEAAGVVLTFSAGNEGPAPATLLSPADRATDHYNGFSVGSIGPNDAVSDFSSRGPSGCGGAYAVKPEVTAPGEDIRSCWLNHGYVTIDGTSMAGPHVAGVVALIRAANPDLDVISIKEILLATARDLGTPGEDDDYGHGAVDAFAAVQRALGGFGEVRGVVRDTGGTPLAAATVFALSAPEAETRLSGPDGSFRISLPAGEALLGVSLFGYETSQQTILVPDGSTLPLDVTLTLRPTTGISGTVTDVLGVPLPGARVHAQPTPLPPAVTDASGAYALQLPTGSAYTLSARADDHFRRDAAIHPDAPLVVDFSLPLLTDEGFESGDFSAYPWRTAGDAAWTVDAAQAFEGSFSARSGAIVSGQTSELSVELDVSAGDLVFHVRTRSDMNDRLVFLVDGMERGAWSGRLDWTEAPVSLDPGSHVLTWRYVKDRFVDAYDDAVWIDGVARPRPPRVSWSPEGITAVVGAGGAATVPLLLGNSGLVDLRFDAEVDMDGAGVPSPQPPPAGKGAPDARKGEDMVASSGGPDAFGYRWIDSDDPDGPTFLWEDISGTGQALGFLDDSLQTLALPFDFPFYGRSFPDVTVCSNGWLTFTEPYIHFVNFSIPDSQLPNSLICPYWEDLDPEANGTIYAFSDPEGGRFIIQWDEVPHWNTPRNQTFQVQLHDDGRILCQYLTVSMADECTVGLENHAGTSGLQVVFAGDYLHNDLALLFRPSTPWLRVEPDAGAVPPGQSLPVAFVFDAEDTPAGRYAGEVRLATNDPDQPRIVVPVDLTVGEDVGTEDPPASPPDPRTALLPPRPNPFNPSTVLRFELAQPGPCRLDIVDLQGRRVRRLVSDRLPAGPHHAVWNGEDDRGRPVASGAYRAVLDTDGARIVRSVTLLK